MGGPIRSSSRASRACGGSSLTRAAASSMASDSPSSRRQISATAAALPPQGDLRGAASPRAEGYRIAAGAGDQASAAYYLEALADVARPQDNPRRVVRLLASAAHCSKPTAAGCTHGCRAPGTAMTPWRRCAPAWAVPYSTTRGRVAGPSRASAPGRSPLMEADLTRPPPDRRRPAVARIWHDGCARLFHPGGRLGVAAAVLAKPAVAAVGRRGAEVDDAGWLQGERERGSGDQARGGVPSTDAVVAAIHAEGRRVIVPGVDAARCRWAGGDVRSLGCAPAGRPGPGAARVRADVDPAAAVCFDRREEPLAVVQRRALRQPPIAASMAVRSFQPRVLRVSARIDMRSRLSHSEKPGGVASSGWSRWKARAASRVRIQS
jgi:hypothetical protein